MPLRKLVLMLMLFPVALLFAQPLADQSEEMICKEIDEYRASFGSLARPVTNDAMFDYDVKWYDLYFDLDPVNEIIHARTQILFQSEVNALSTVILDLTDVLTVDSVFGAGTEFTRGGDLITITLTDTLALGEQAILGIAYHGQPQAEVGFQGFEFGSHNGHPIISTLSEPYGARSWWPCKDSPRDKADSVAITIRAPGDLIAVSNGMLVNTIDNLDGSKTWFWQHNYPITTYLVHLAVTNYEYWTDVYHFSDGDSMPLEYWVYPEYYSTFYTRWQTDTPYIMDAYNELFGKYPYENEKYGMVQFNWGGGMEHQTCSSMGGAGEILNAHEMAHQWWGDMITCADFHHIWLNEGFAAYSEALYAENRFGTASYFSAMSNKDWDFYGSIYRVDTTSVNSIFNRIVYDKAAWVLHMLRHVVGDENFFDILTQWRNEYEFSTVRTEDFQNVAENVYGSDLTWFFDEWIYGAGRPLYRWWWGVQNTNNDSTIITLQVDQTQDNSYPTYTMPIDIHLSDATHDTVLVVWNDSRSQEFSLALPFNPGTVQFDPEKWVYRRATQVTSLDEETLLANDFSLGEGYPNPFNGAVTFPIHTGFRQVVKVSIFNILGEQVFSDQIVADGTYRYLWSGISSESQVLGSGVYLVRIDNGDFQHQMKISFIK